MGLKTGASIIQRAPIRNEPAGADEYLTIAEVAHRARCSAKTIRNKMASGILRKGVHYSRPRGLGPRFRSDSIRAWLDGSDVEEKLKEGIIPMAGGYKLGDASLTHDSRGNIQRGNGLHS